MMIVPGRMPIVQHNIDCFGQHVFGVFGGGTPPFSYTIGNANRHLPELLLIGNFRLRTMIHVLNDLGALMRDLNRFLEGDVSLGGQFPVRIRRASDQASRLWTIQAGQYLGHENYDVLQVLICDYEGRFPGETGCDPIFEVPLA